LAVERLRWAAGVDVVDALAAAVGDPWLLHRIWMLLAIGVAEPDLEQRLADRPRNGLVDPVAAADRPLRVVQAGGLVEVPGEEDRIALLGQLRHCRERPRECRGADPVLILDHGLHRLAVLQRARAPVDV